MRKSSRQPRIKRVGLLEECLKRLEYDNVLVITGKSGFGKSCLCQDILKELHFDFDVYILKYPDEWKQVDITQDIQPLIFIDNFGRNSNQQDIELEWNIEEMIEYSKKGKIELLLAVELDVLERMKYQLRDYICFSNQKVVNISSDQWKLSYEEKHRLFDIFYKSQSYKGPKINEDELKFMLNCEPVLGFLVTCHDFFNCSHNELKVIEFFKSSEVDFAERVKDLSESSPNLFALLVTLLFSNSPSLQRDCIPEYKEVCCKLNIDIDEQSDLQSKFQKLLSMGLVTSCNDVYTFRCKYVEAEVLLLFANNYEDVILNKCDTSFINRYIRPSTYVKKHGEVCVCLDSKHDSFLSKNIINNIASLSVQQGDSLKDCLNNPALEDSEFFQGILKEIQRILTDADMLGKCRDVLYWTCFYGKYEMTKILLNYLISSDQMTANVFNKALEHLRDCDFSCEKLLLLFATSPYGHFASPENILKLIEHSSDIGFTPDCFRLFLSKVTVSYDVICDLLSTSVDVSHRNEDKTFEMVRIILDLHQSFKLSSNEKIDFILKCIDLGVHTNENMLEVLKTTFSHCRGVTDFLKVFERYIETDNTNALCISLLRTWWELHPGNNYIHNIYKHVFVKTMQKEWYPTYIKDETIKSLISDLHVWEFMFILQNALSHEKCINFTKSLLQGSHFNKDFFVHLLQKLLSNDEKYLFYILKLIPTSKSDTDAVDESDEWITSYMNDDKPLPSPLSDISATDSVDESVLTVPIPHMEASKFSEEENMIIFCLLFPSETLKQNEFLYGDIKFHAGHIKPTSDLFVSLMLVIGKEVLSNDFCLSVIHNILSHVGKVKMGMLSSFITEKSVKFSIPGETGLHILNIAARLQMPSLIQALIDFQKIEITNNALLHMLISLHKGVGDSGHQCFNLVKSIIYNEERGIYNDVHLGVVMFCCELKFLRSKEECCQSLIRLLNAVGQNSNQDPQDVYCDEVDKKESTIHIKQEEYDIFNIVKATIQSGALTSLLGHEFLMTFLVMVPWKQITYTKLLDMFCIKLPPHNLNIRSYACSIFRKVLRFVDEFSDIRCDNTDNLGEWCAECVKTLLISSAVKSSSRGTALYLINGIIQNGLEDCMHDIVKADLYTKLEAYDRQNAVKQLLLSNSFTKTYDHNFLLPLLSSVNLAYISNKAFLDIIKNYKLGKNDNILSCDTLQRILHVVGDLGDISSDNTDHNGKWCEKCTKAILLSPAVKSASRRIAAYLIKGIIAKDILNYKQELSQSMLWNKLISSYTFNKMYDHEFLSPLLSSANSTHITNERVLDIIMNCKLDKHDSYILSCDTFQRILHVVDDLGDISIYNTVHNGKWCEKCTKAILLSPAVKSATRGTAVYLITGIINNGYEDMHDVIESTLCTILKLLIQSDTFTTDYEHNFLLSFLSSANWAHITKEAFLNILMNFKLIHYDYTKRCDLFQSILSVVDELSNISSDNIDCPDDWCEKCTKAILMSSAARSMSRETAFYLISRSIQHGSIQDVNDIRESSFWSKLEEYDILNIVKRLTQSGAYTKESDHEFLLPLLSHATWTQKTNDECLKDPSRCKLFEYASCRHTALFRCIFLLVEELSDIGSESRDIPNLWCEDCLRAVLISSSVKSASRDTTLNLMERIIEIGPEDTMPDVIQSNICTTVLKSAAVDSVSRRTALYFMKGIIQNEMKCQKDILIQSPVFRKVNFNDIICVIKDLKKYNFYKLFLEQLPLSDTDVLHCIQHIINDEATQTELKLNAENDPVTAILNSKHAKIRSSQTLSDIIRFILTHDYKYSYRRVLCALSIESAAVMSSVAIGELLVEILKQREKFVESDVYVKRKQSLELKLSCTLILLSKLIKIVYDENTKSSARTTVSNVNHDSAYGLHIHDCPIITVVIKFDRNWQTHSLSVSSLLSKYSEDDSIKALVNLISIADCDIDKMLRMLLDSLAITLCGEMIETLLIAIVIKELNFLKQKDLMTEYEQPAFNTSRLMAVIGSKHGHVKLPQTSVIKIIEKMIISYVDSSEAIGIIADAQLSEGLNYELLRHLLKLTVNTPFIATTEYMELFIRKMKVAKLTTDDAIELLTDCFNSMDDKSKTVITILDLIKEENVKQIILNEVIMDIIETNGVRNAATLDCLSQSRLFSKDIVATLVTNLVLKLRCTNTQIRVNYEKCSKTQCLLLKLLHVFLSYDTRRLNDITLIPVERIHFAVRHSVTITVSYDAKEIFKRGRFLSQLPDDDINEMFTLNLSLSKIPCNMLCALFNFQQNPNISRAILVKVTLKAVESEKLVNHIVLIMLQNYNKQKLTDEDMSVLMCAILRRKYGGREQYMESLLSQSLGSQIGERSISEALCVAMSSIRNNENIVSLILSAAEELNVTLSDDKYGLILETLLECKHKRVAHYTRTVVQSSISPEMSDKTFLAAVSTIMNHNISKRDLLQVLLFHKPTLSQGCRASLEGLKQTGRRVDFKHDAIIDNTEINDADVRDEDELVCGNDSVSQEDDNERINDDDSVINHIAKDRTDGDKNQTDENDDIIPIDNGSVSMQIDEDERKKDNDAEMNDDDDDSVLDKIDDNERIRFIDDILTNYS